MIKNNHPQDSPLPDVLEPIRIPTELRNYVLQICKHFFLPDMIWRAAFDAIRKHGKNPYYSDKNYRAVAAGLVSVIVEEGIYHNWYKGSRIKNVDLADYRINRKPYCLSGEFSSSIIFCTASLS